MYCSLIRDFKRPFVDGRDYIISSYTREILSTLSNKNSFRFHDRWTLLSRYLRHNEFNLMRVLISHCVYTWKPLNMSWTLNTLLPMQMNAVQGEQNSLGLTYVVTHNNWRHRTHTAYLCTRKVLQKTREHATIADFTEGQYTSRKW